MTGKERLESLQRRRIQSGQEPLPSAGGSLAQHGAHRFRRDGRNVRTTLTLRLLLDLDIARTLVRLRRRQGLESGEHRLEFGGAPALVGVCLEGAAEVSRAQRAATRGREPEHGAVTGKSAFVTCRLSSRPVGPFRWRGDLCADGPSADGFRRGALWRLHPSKELIEATLHAVSAWR